MLARQRGDDHVELFQRHDAVRHSRLADMTDKIEKQLDRRIVRQGKHFVKHVARPILVEHLFFGDQDDVAARGFAFAHEIAAFEEGGEADDVRWI